MTSICKLWKDAFKLLGQRQQKTKKSWWQHLVSEKQLVILWPQRWQTLLWRKTNTSHFSNSESSDRLIFKVDFGWKTTHELSVQTPEGSKGIQIFAHWVFHKVLNLAPILAFQRLNLSRTPSFIRHHDTITFVRFFVLFCLSFQQLSQSFVAPFSGTCCREKTANFMSLNNKYLCICSVFSWMWVTKDLQNIRTLLESGFCFNDPKRMNSFVIQKATACYSEWTWYKYILCTDI